MRNNRAASVLRAYSIRILSVLHAQHPFASVLHPCNIRVASALRAPARPAPRQPRGGTGARLAEPGASKSLRESIFKRFTVAIPLLPSRSSDARGGRCFPGASKSFRESILLKGFTFAFPLERFVFAVYYPAPAPPMREGVTAASRSVPRALSAAFSLFMRAQR